MGRSFDSFFNRRKKSCGDGKQMEQGERGKEIDMKGRKMKD